MNNSNIKKFSIFGDPVEHSKSPQMHNAGFKSIDFQGEYTKHHLLDGEKIKDEFLSSGYLGSNITVPHKEWAFQKADIVEGLAKEIGAVNTYILKDGKVVAYNTDAPGFMKAIEDFPDVGRVLIIGAGGTAKAIAVALKDKDIETAVLNRSKKRLDYFQKIDCLTYSWDDFSNEGFDLVVNCTSAGLKDDDLPAPKEILEEIFSTAQYAFDCIYGKMTPFLDLAKENSLKIKDGEDMLLYQGVLAFEYFTDIKSDEALVEAMRTGLKGE